MNQKKYRTQDARSAPYGLAGRLKRAAPTLIGTAVLGVVLAGSSEGLSLASWIAGGIGCVLVLFGVARLMPR